MTPTAKKLLIGAGALVLIGLVVNFVVLPGERSTPTQARGVAAR
jgi:hypothetical protein